MEEIKAAAEALVKGNLVAFPTETVWGLGADAENPDAVAKIYKAKQRPADHPLIVHICSSEEISQWADVIPEYARELAKAFWPGPMTLVLKRSDIAKDFITGGQPTVGLRVPDHPTALELLREFQKLGGRGIAAPSANRFGKVSTTSAEDVRDEIGAALSDQDIILDGETPRVGIESTIIDCTKSLPVILRPGAITPEMIHDQLGLELGTDEKDIRVSGSHKSHYAPAAKVVLEGEAKPGDGFIALGNIPTPSGVVRLCSPEDVYEYAKELYAALRKADQLGLARVVAIPPEGEGIALAIRDRLERASRG